MKINELDKYDYFLYTNTMGHVMQDHSRTFWLFFSLLFFSGITAAYAGWSIYFILAAGLCFGMLLLNYVSVILKIFHVKKLYSLTDGFSLLK